MQTVSNSYPYDYRAKEVTAIRSAARAGQCVSVVGLSGAGKSNLLRFLAELTPAAHDSPRFILLDCNRLPEVSLPAVWAGLNGVLNQALGSASDPSGGSSLQAVEQQISRLLDGVSSLCILFDRFDLLLGEHAPLALPGNLRILRDTFKYRLTYLIATRQVPDPQSELGELFYAHTIWLGPLSRSDAHWSAASFAARVERRWSSGELATIWDLSWGYPALLRAVCEAYAAGTQLEPEQLAGHPAVRQRILEFWADTPDQQALRLSRLLGQPLLERFHPQSGPIGEGEQFTAKEHALLTYFQAHQEQVCSKDDLIRAVWPEDQIFEQGVRDDSLAQLVRRLRLKLEPDPGDPRYIITVTGRGYCFRS